MGFMVCLRWARGPTIRPAFAARETTWASSWSDAGRGSQTAAADIPRQVRGDAIQRIAAVGLVVVGGGGAQESVERFLKQVFGELTVSGKAGEVRPQSARGSLVERAECV